MRDIPVFTTENGVASLVLKEIPYRQTAYVRIQDASDPDAFIEECGRFCRMAGAEKVYATGHLAFERYPLHTQVLQMSRMRDGLPDTDASLFPVTEQTLTAWLEIYNDRMADTPNAAYMDSADGRLLLESGNAYFVHRNGELLGIGIASGDRIDAVIAVLSGMGETVVLALNHALSGERIALEVASANERAVGLYNRLGFSSTSMLSQWHQI